MEPPLPKGHRDLTFPDMARLTFDEHDNLCLDGKPIEVRKMTLTKWQAFLGALGAIGALVGGLAAAIIAYFQIMDRF